MRLAPNGDHVAAQPNREAVIQLVQNQVSRASGRARMLRRFALVILAGCAAPVGAQEMGERAAADAVEPLIIGESLTLRSDVLDETRRINVYVPAAYEARPGERFPVLYMPDGGTGEDFLHIAGLVQISSLNRTMRPFILVGIENTERRRDLTGPTNVQQDLEIAPRVGGSAEFRAFIRDELMPRIDRTYRTSGETAIVGESLAGLFVVETLLLEPSLFDSYLAIDPSLWWNGGHLVDTARPLLQEQDQLNAALFLATSSQTEIAELTARLATLLEGAVPELHVSYQQFPQETHLTIYHPAALRGFRVLFSPPNG